MNRAQFLVAAALASPGLRDVLRRPASAEAAAGPRPGTWDAIRGEFALAPGVTQLSAFLLASHPRPVREAIERHRRGLDANPHGYLDHAASFEERARRSAAQSLGSQPSQVALTDSTTMGLGLLYGGLRLAAGDEVLTTVHDFYSTHAALELRAAATGARVRKISLYRDLRHVSEAEIVASVAAALRPETRYVAVTWVHSSTGLKLPIRQIAAAVRRANASRSAGRQIRLCVDGVHGFAVEPEPVASLGCDFFVSGCHKWLFGPRGTGLVWAKDPAWAGASEIIPSFDRQAIGAWIRNGPSSPLSGAQLTPGGFHTFEHRWALDEAFRFHRRIGSARIAARTHELAARLKEELARLRGVHVQTPAAARLSSGLVCCTVDGHDPNDFVQRLFDKHRIVASVTPYAQQLVRFGPTIVNSHEEIDRTVRAVHALT